MKILVSNDDGIQATGIQTLVEHLSPLHDVYVVAPDRERSAMGHALTLHRPIKINEVQLPYPVKAAYATSGTPSDCVKLALSTLIEEDIDLVVSGINHGPNLGADVMYSGTVSAALEGAIFDKPSIALSLMDGYEKHADFSESAKYFCEQLDRLVALEVPTRSILNINFPGLPRIDYAGLKGTKLGLRMYKDFYDRRTDPRGGVYYWLAGEIVEHTGQEEEDVEAIQNNWVSVTPIHLDLTNHSYFEKLKNDLMPTP